MLTSLTAGMAVFFAALPRIVAAALIVAIGWYVGSAVARMAAPHLPRISLKGFDVQLAALLKWVVRLIALLMAFDVLGLTAVSALLGEVLAWLPHLAVAVVVLVIASYLADAAGNSVGNAMRGAGIGNASVAGAIARAGVWASAFVVALHEVGVGDELVRILFTGTVTAVVLAGGLAVGLGGQEVAARMLQRWYGASAGAFDSLAKSAQRAADEARERERRREVDLDKLAKLWKRLGPAAPAVMQAARRRIDRGRVPGDGDFKELTVEMAEAAEEPVIAARAHVVEEVRVRIEVSQHAETVRDAVRATEAHVEQFRN